MSDLIDRQAAIDAFDSYILDETTDLNGNTVREVLENLPSAQPTFYRYDIEYLEVIADVLRKENLSPERIAEWLMDIDRIIAIVRDEFAETLRWVLQD